MGASPSLPLVSSSEISGDIEVGRVFSIRARVTPDPASFSVNLMCPNGDIAFHFNPRFDEESPVVVCNTWTNGKWGSEDRTLQMPFRQGEPFEMAITVQLACYEVCVNGAYLLKYAHRLPVHTVKKLEYRGGIKFEENGSPLPQVDPPPYSPPRNVAPDNGPGTDVKDDPAENVMILIPAWEETNPLDSHETPRTEDGSDSPPEGCCFCRLFVPSLWLRWTKWRIGGDCQVHMRKA